MTETANKTAQAPADELRAELERCTKAELIALIKNVPIPLRPENVRQARGEFLYERGLQLTKQALAMMDEARGPFRRPGHRELWVRGSRLFDRAMAMRNRADTLRGWA